MPARAPAKNTTRKKTAKEKPKESIGEIVRTIIYALLIAVAFRTVLYQPFSIPSGSMKSTLLVGDYLFVSKFAYGYSQHSCPWAACPIEGRILGEDPERGDVIVFKKDQAGGCSEGLGVKLSDAATWAMRQVGLTNARRPADCIDYIKRLIGLPGDVIQVIEGVLHINGEPVKMERVGEFREHYHSEPCIDTPTENGQAICVREVWRETLPNGVAHLILNSNRNRGRVDNTPPVTVPPGHYFFMGDNRDNSTDSRFSDVGLIPYDRLVGRAEMMFLSSEGAFWEVWKWRFSRFFQFIE